MESRKKRIYGLLASGAAVFLLYFFGKPIYRPLYDLMPWRRTLKAALAQIEPGVRQRLEPKFRALELPFPPLNLVLVAYKKEKQLELWTWFGAKPWKVHAWPILSMSGGPGPKLKRGDLQVPEGFYRVEGLNANSQFHLSIKLDYPNAFDSDVARRDGRNDIGDNIFIHGSQVSTGCIAIGNPGIEELFYVVHAAGPERIKVLIVPQDMTLGLPPSAGWVPVLYRALRDELNLLKGRVKPTEDY